LAIDTIINTGGVQSVGGNFQAQEDSISNDGTAIGITINSGGQQYVSYGGTASGTTVNSGGQQYVSYGGTASGTTIFGSGTEFVSSAATASDITISGGTAVLAAGAIASGGIKFDAPGGTLRIDDPAVLPRAIIAGFGPGDLIDLAAVAFDNSGTINLKPGNTLEITQGGKAYDLNLDPLQAYGGDYFALSADNSSGTNITLPPQPPNISVSNDLSARRAEEIPVSDLVSILDPYGIGYTQLELWDSNGTNTGGQFVVNGSYETGGHEIDVAPAEVTDTAFIVGALGGTDTLWAQLLQLNGQLTGWRQFTVTAPIETPPGVSAQNVWATHGQTFSASSLFTASDPDGDSITKYAFWNAGTGRGHFALSNVAQTANQEIDVTAGQLQELSYQTGSGADTLWVRVNDGAQWSPWSQSFTVTAPVDTGPVVTPTQANFAALHGQSFAASSLFTASDPFGDPITQYDFWDSGTGGGHFTVTNQTLSANRDNYVAPSQLAQTTYQSGSGADTLWVRVSDGTQWSPWSQSFTVTAPFDTGPTVTPVSASISATHNQSFAVSSLFTASDPFNDAITQYDFWDTGIGGGHFALNGQTLGANQDNYILGSQVAQLSYQSGTGTDTLWMRANDGTVWGAWSQALTVTAPVDTGPVVASVSSIKTTVGQTFAASNLFSATDPFNDPIEQYDFWDTGTGGGHFLLNNQTLGANQGNYVAASQLSQAQYVSGSGTDTLWVRVSEGGQWSPWSPGFTVSDPTSIGAGETLELTSVYSGTITFKDTTGTLQLDNSASFSGTVAGLTGNDTLDLRDITAGVNATVAYSGTSAGGALSVSDGVHSANIALLGNYLASTFVTASDGHGWTNVQNQPDSPATLVAQLH
jgi:autotransporter passenger strand-loop-strand repeat protein